MKTEDQHHQQLIKGIALEYEEILNSSHQAIYIWLDEERMVCNSKFSTLLGYNSPEELSSQKGSFLDLFVAESDQQILANAYQNAMTQQNVFHILAQMEKEIRRHGLLQGQPGSNRIWWTFICLAFY